MPAVYFLFFGSFLALWFPAPPAVICGHALESIGNAAFSLHLDFRTTHVYVFALSVFVRPGSCWIASAQGGAAQAGAGATDWPGEEESFAFLSREQAGSADPDPRPSHPRLLRAIQCG